ncbi:hypothetical protein F2Q68_00044812 [Brassica cretica]|uniref:Uncharacterized protein n=1 Tax=Brassica cretica TaxID=69181 RepID=A0A8S9LLG7_BRACR|nr:hypothetical protein F2Q68_00044812 [Brassica cretica]
MDSSLAVTRRRSFPRSRSDLAVTRLALSRSLDSRSRGHSTRSLAVTRLALSQLLGSDCSLVSSMT